MSPRTRGGARNFPTGADSSDEWAKIWFSGYYKCQKSPKNRVSPSDEGASLLRQGAMDPSPPLEPPLPMTCLGGQDLPVQALWRGKGLNALYKSPEYLFCWEAKPYKIFYLEALPPCPCRYVPGENTVSFFICWRKHCMHCF